MNRAERTSFLAAVQADPALEWSRNFVVSDAQAGGAVIDNMQHPTDLDLFQPRLWGLLNAKQSWQVILQPSKRLQELAADMRRDFTPEALEACLNATRDPQLFWDNLWTYLNKPYSRKRYLEYYYSRVRAVVLGIF